MHRALPKSFSFIWILAGLCLFYLSFELFFNAYAMLSVDEFWFAHRTWQYKDGLPYRDFAPYKTVLGYYLLLLPMLITHGIFNTLIVMKDAMALLNTLILFSGAWWLTRFFSRPSVLLSVALLIFSETFLSYSTNIRVDLPGYWFCFFSLLCLLERRFLLAGLLLGFGFITTQKCVWYIAASNIALILQSLFIERDRKILLHLIRMNSASVLVIGIYLCLWSLVSTLPTVLHSVFFEASAMYQLDWYDNARKLYWTVITVSNPLLFLLWPCTLLGLSATTTNDHAYSQRAFVTLYASVILLCLLPYKQIFPYYMQVTFPVLLVLYAAFFSWVYALFTPQATVKLFIAKKYIWLLIASYLVALVYVIASFGLPNAYLFLCLLPILLGLGITRGALSIYRQLFFLTVFLMGAVYPLILFSQKVIAINGDYQKATIHAMVNLLENKTDYVAGIELIYNKTQPIPGLRHLMGPAITYLDQPTPALRAVMLASLYEDPQATTDSVIAALNKASVSFYVNNYRMAALPAAIQHYLASNFMHWSGSIYTYAPQIATGEHTIHLKISGHYKILTAATMIRLQDKSYRANTNVYLQQGDYLSEANQPYRLQWLPDVSKDNNLAVDQPEKVIF